MKGKIRLYIPVREYLWSEVNGYFSDKKQRPFLKSEPRDFDFEPALAFGKWREPV
jgi:hypothetical protein